MRALSIALDYPKKRNWRDLHVRPLGARLSVAYFQLRVGFLPHGQYNGSPDLYCRSLSHG